MDVVRFFVELLKLPAIVVGLIALIGLVAQRKRLSEVVTGTLKTTLSLLIIGGGIGVLINALLPIQTMFELGIDKNRFDTFVTFDEAVVSAVQNANVGNIGVLIGWTLLFGYAFHLFLARVTPFRYVYLTGHMIWIHAGAYAILYDSFGLPSGLTILLASLTFGTYMTLAPAAAQPVMRRITGSDEVAFGHGQTILNLVAAGAGRLVGKRSRSTEEMHVPEGLNFFRDIAVSTTLVMLVVAFIAALLAVGQVGVDGFQKAFAEQIPKGQSWLVFTLLQALGFTAGMLILLFGVRMLIAEIVPAFHGIAERLIPGAKPALDVPVIFPFAPNALIVGLISGLIGQIAGMAALVAIGWPVPIPSMIVAFFASGAGAIFGNATGGRRGAWLGGFLWGFLGWLIISYAYHEKIFGDLSGMGAKGLAFTVPDAIVPGIIIHWIAQLFGA
ncbi:MAG: ascorbate system component [Solirubrobacteraceae bacterium]|jgi:PTS system ascorbate-specific IIC component|nr:ascorbate system component [Solirubrobacteraceae bacterium]